VEFSRLAECSRRSPSELFRGTVVLARTSLSLRFVIPISFLSSILLAALEILEKIRGSLCVLSASDPFTAGFGMGSFESSMAESSWFSRSLTRSSESVVVGDYKTRGSERSAESSTQQARL
jgi:hypothetical protein